MVDYIASIAEELKKRGERSDTPSDEQRKRNLLEAMQLLAAKAHQSETEIMKKNN